ncbi:phage holin family protein [Sphingoaurantiacus capsulatus]|uniref:Phage holin family protein n=1 Tax=Sphingoaurantiacus capsulatus TaxID=1771310 RepID=A0ABV7XDU0_9SPHN
MEKPDRKAREKGPSIGDMVRSLLLDVTQLIRTEIKLAQAEVGENVERAKRPLMLLTLGLMLALASGLVFIAFLVAALAPLIGVAGAALLVAVVTGGGGFALIRAAQRELKNVSLAPARVVARMEQDVQALKDAGE